MFLSIGAAVGGWVLAKRSYGKAEKGYVEPINAAVPAVYNALFNKWYVDEAYDYVVTGRRPIAGNMRLGMMGLGNGLWRFDANVIDGGVNGAGWSTRFISKASMAWDKYVIDGAMVNGPAYLTRALSYPVRLVQWGLVQWYALVMVVGIVGLGIYFVVR
jgi:NADH-quinone oxidoreductase subunit L